MKRIAQALITVLFLASAPAFAGDIWAMHAFSRATAPKAPNGAAFMALMNQGSEDLAVIAASSSVAARVELHTHLKEDGVMKMRQVPQIDIPAGGEVILQPGSYHVMLLGLHAPLKQGESFDVTLELSNGESLTVDVPIQSAGALMEMSHDGMDHGEMTHGDMDQGDMDHSDMDNSSMGGSGTKAKPASGSGTKSDSN